LLGMGAAAEAEACPDEKCEKDATAVHRVNSRGSAFAPI
jgi:hypothetical protein